MFALFNFLGDSYFEAAEEKAFDATPDSGIHELGITDPEQRAKLEEEWRLELAKVCKAVPFSCTQRSTIEI